MTAERIDLLQELSRRAGAHLKQSFGLSPEALGIERKQTVLDLVTVADRSAEAIFLEAITARFPDDAIIAEESGSRDGDSGYQWIIDPLDGTTNFSHGFPHFCVSAGLAFEGSLIAGVVYDPIKNEFFEAQRGQGARCNGEPITVGNREELNEALIVTGFPYDRRERVDVLLERVRRILLNGQGLRRLGSAALDLAYVACGRFDVFIEDGLQPWDMAAGMLLVAEAGGGLIHFNGEQATPFFGEIIAANTTLLPLAREHLV